MTLFGNRILTSRLQLRRIESEDLPLLVHWSNDPASYGDYLTPERLSSEQLRDQLHSGALWSESRKIFLIELREGPPIGTLHYWLRHKEAKTAAISVRIASPEQRGKGYGTEAQKGLMSLLFNREGVAQVEMYTDVNNEAQQRCLRKLGFEIIQVVPYIDQEVQRIGYLYCLRWERFHQDMLYQNFYE